MEVRNSLLFYNVCYYRWFERFIMFCIIANSILLTLYDYEDRESIGFRNRSVNLVGDIFTVLFLFEALLKIGATGFVFHRYAYLRDSWNFADFVIVITG